MRDFVIFVYIVMAERLIRSSVYLIDVTIISFYGHATQLEKQQQQNSTKKTMINIYGSALGKCLMKYIYFVAKKIK